MTSTTSRASSGQPGPDIWELAASAAAVIGAAWKLAFTNLILARGDVLLYFYPLWDYRARALAAGRLPLWAPELFMGAPFLANSQTGVLYPLNWLLVPLAAPLAVKAAILIHLVIAAWGAQVFARRRLGLSAAGGLAAALLFALGGYLTAQVEHVNQLQALAWFPWLLWALDLRPWPWRVGAIAGLVALQILAGHTQSVLISAVGAGLYALAQAGRSRPDQTAAARLLAGLAAGAVLGAALAGAQLLPTVELSRESLRSGGLSWREAVSFSLDPRVLGRALLPGYARSLFSEYVGYLGVSGLALAVLGIERSRRGLAVLVLAAAGLALALGAFNPLSAGLAALPPFNLFRVPARWLVLFAFAAAQLAGLGIDRAAGGAAGTRRLVWAMVIPAGLIVASPLPSALTLPGETGPLGAPAGADWAGWITALGLTGLLLWLPGAARWRAPALLLLAVAELAAASQHLPLNQLTAPEAYASARPALTQLLTTAGETPPPRYLSLSSLQFDPGDLAELHAELDSQIPASDVYDYVVATKHKEVLSPNLALAWGIPAVDGFDGGILPLRHYAAFTQLFTGAPSKDGRLRENLAAAPDNRLLSLTNTRWLVTDKVADAWDSGVYFDRQFSLTVPAGQAVTIAALPHFEATGLELQTAAPPGGRLLITEPSGPPAEWPIRGRRVEFGRPVTAVSMTLVGPLSVEALTLVDARSGAFQSLTLGPYRLAHSGDVKVYDNLAVQARAFVAAEARPMADDAAARAWLADPDNDLGAEILVSAPAPWTPPPAGRTGPATITRYAPEWVQIKAAGPGYLTLTDAAYPGWEVWVDGAPAVPLRADIAFRAVALPAGEHVVEWRFRPAALAAGAWLSGLGGAAFVALAWAGWRRRPAPLREPEAGNPTPLTAD